jgi:dipeptidyl-peptidase-4
MPKRIFVLAILLIAAPCASAEPLLRLPLLSTELVPAQGEGEKDKLKKKITLDNLPGLGFGGVAPISWLDDDYYLQTKGGNSFKVHALSGKADPFQAVGAGVKLPNIAGAEMMTASPDGKSVAFVRKYNLFVFDLATQKERQLTRDGDGILSNGKADWVYYEEIFHRKYKAFWWSPDSTHIAFLHFDDRKVTRYTLINPTQRVQVQEVATYPKAGATNPAVKVGIAAVQSDSLQWVDLDNYADKSLLVIRAGWFPDSKKAYFFVQDRAQTWLDVCTVAVGGKTVQPAKLLRETTKAWVMDHGPLYFLKDSSFLFFSERTGYKHLYHYAADGQLKGAVTSGEWEARSLQSVDDKDGWIYFSGTRDGWLVSNSYRVKLDGSELERLTPKAGTHNVNISPSGKYFVDTCSSYDTPPQVCLCHGSGELIRIIDSGAANKLSETYELGKHEFVQIKMPDGFVLPATVLLPPDFDAKKKYPVWFKTYGGPHAPTIRNVWSGGGAQDQAVATMGFIIFHFDPRSASGMGAASAWTAYRQLGVQELKDIEAALLWLIATYPAVDAKRIGMSGHSYGGYITAYALTHSKMFAAGMAGSPVTDWHNYDSIYTERYMGTPQDNPKGYEVSSVTKAAKNLHGKLLIAHGMMDDNVHVQNAMELVDALQKADRDFEIMVYPGARHGLPGKHYQRLQLEFMKRTLHPGIH